ncbi:fungal-specific transcription factor domain-containing protein [Mycena vulgaris]|nr:fungal-specific transcription factor domain-containing protein [Mycena vulgaris]
MAPTEQSYHEGPSSSVPEKKRRIQRACDSCRLKKRSCDVLRISAQKCTNCVANSLDCTFTAPIAKRRSYVDALEARLELTEQLLRKLSPQSETPAATPRPMRSQWSKDSPILTHANGVPVAASSGPGVDLATLTIRSMNTPPPAPRGDDLEHIALTQNMGDLSVSQHRERFHGTSSGAMLVKTAVQLREGYEQRNIPWTSRRMKYWTFNPTKDHVPHVGPYVFPDADLLSALIDLYFTTTNLYYPLLHRPTFERSIEEGLHSRDTSFGAVVLLVCAIGSRFSDDPRVCGPGAEPLRCGWQYFEQLPHGINHLFVRPTVYHLQYYCLAVEFLAPSMPTACWTLIGFGIRVAQDVGAHRAMTMGPTTVESELWKRAFWGIVCMDRLCSTILGRPCTTQYEDFDVELPLECDDEFWENEDPALAFKQPPGKPSQIAFFNSFIRLTHILAVSLKMLYSLNKAKALLAVRDAAWEEHIVAELDSALNSWVDTVPSHLRWDPNLRDDNFFDQSAFLYCTYYQVQMTIHRPFIPMIRKGVTTALPSLAICTNAARSCSHISDISRRRKNGTPVPWLLSATFTSGLVLLLNVWSGKRTGLRPEMNSAISEVYKCMASIRVSEERWQSAGLSWDLLYELAAIGQLPLPTQLPPPASPAGDNSNKRRREEEPEPQEPHSIAAVHFPPYDDRYPTIAPHPASTVDQFAVLPTCSTDLGRLPVFHPYADGSSWDPTETSALESPDFAARRTPADDAVGVFSAEEPALMPGGGYPPGFGADLNAMANDVMAMWVNAPTGFESDDWETYLNIINELNQEPGTGGVQT